jgi:ElaB/YqjD/DUF883 family membrane-anchored ribosome-binding protein
MQTTSDGNKGTASSPNSTEPPRQGGSASGPAAGAATEIARHYGDHGQPATTSAGPSPQDAASHQSGQAGSAASGASEAVRDVANRATEQAGSAMAKVGETAQNLANRAGEQAGPAVQAVYDQGARAGEYMTRNIHEYPATALLIAAAVGYGLAYLIHGGSRREHQDRYEWRARG